MDLERDFQAWAERRDPAALTRVFDATAGRLVLLAAHLGGGSSGAEDLVQATFLAAMSRAGSWDRRRPLWPWLAGILHNEARMHWRRQQRRRETDLDAAASAPSDGPDPQALAAGDESFAAALAAIDGLPLPYRQVLRLRLVHGLQPIEIARALEQPVGTVRAQLHRGLAQLRSALPASLAVAAAAWLAGDGALLAQVRTKVLAEATAAAAAATTTTAGATAGATLITAGWWTMHGKTIALLAVAAALLLGLLARFGGFADEIPAGGAATRSTAEAGAVVAAPRDAVAAAAERELIPAPASATWSLEVVVTRAGAPVADATVRVVVMPFGFSGETDVPAAAREALTTGATGADGIFRCPLDQLCARSALFARSTGVFVEATTSDGSRDVEHVSLPHTGAQQTVRAELQLQPGPTLHGRVVDAEGQPIAGAEVFEIFGKNRDYSFAATRSSGDGSFAVAGDAERWPDALAVAEPTHGCATVAVPAAADAATSVDLGTIVLAGTDAIRGRVTLGDGGPLGDFPLFVARIDPALAGDPAGIRRSFLGRGRQLERHDGKFTQVRASPRTADDGSFACAGLDPDGTYAVCVADSLHARSAMAVARVGENVELVVDMQLLLLDVRGEDGEALPGATVRGEIYDPADERPAYKLRAGFPETGLVGSGAFFSCDAAGRRQVLTPFDRLWCLYATDEFVQSAALRHDVFPGVFRVERTLVLRPALQFGAMRLIVEDQDGKPWPDYGYRMKHLSRDIERNHSRLIPPDDHTYRDLPAGRWQLTVLLGNPLYEVFGLDTPSRGEQQREVVIEDGGTTEVRIVTTPAGRIAFRLQAASPPEDGNWKNVQVTADAGGLEVPCVLHSDDQHVSPWPLASQFRLARAAFAPGHYGFTVSVDGYQPAHCDAEVVDGQLTQVRVELTRR